MHAYKPWYRWRRAERPKPLQKGFARTTLIDMRQHAQASGVSGGPLFCCMVQKEGWRPLIEMRQYTGIRQGRQKKKPVWFCRGMKFHRKKKKRKEKRLCTPGPAASMQEGFIASELAIPAYS
eukprot:1149942-Pelagomonas_calceolata.AAC.1